MKRIIAAIIRRMTSARTTEQWSLDSAVIIPADQHTDSFAVLWREAV